MAVLTRTSLVHDRASMFTQNRLRARAPGCVSGQCARMPVKRLPSIPMASVPLRNFCGDSAALLRSSRHERMLSPARTSTGGYIHRSYRHRRIPRPPANMVETPVSYMAFVTAFHSVADVLVLSCRCLLQTHKLQLRRLPSK